MSDKKKIGILTFHRAVNYGAVLQAFALQEFLKENTLDKNIEFIDFYDDKSYQIGKYKSIQSSSLIKHLVLYILHKIYKTARRKEKFRDFVNKYLSLSEKSWTDKHVFLADCPYYDYYISGSDQVFNPNNKNMEVYFESFQKQRGCKKISYAASVGINDFPVDKIDCIKTLLQDFDYLSCREFQGVKSISELGFTVEHVLDPVFLLNESNWTELLALNRIKKNSKITNDYIFVYDLNGGERLLEKVYLFSKARNLPIYCLTSNVAQRYKVKKIFYNLAPDEFLMYLANAKYILTDSFHGTALSIVFRKTFFVYNSNAKVFNRIESLLSLLRLKSQIIFDDSFKSYKDLNYHEIESIINDNINNSKEFLLKAVDSNK